MARKRVVTQFGMGTSIRSRNYTEAAARAIRDALWHNSLNVAEAFGFPREAMIIDVEIGVQQPDAVDREALLKIFPYGRPAITRGQGRARHPEAGQATASASSPTRRSSFRSTWSLPMAEQRQAEKRIILEMGTGNDLYGVDYTKAACRAVHDALHHSSIVLFKSLGYDHHDMRVQVTIGVQQPDQVDCAAVAAELPRGRAEVRAVHGGLDVRRRRTADHARDRDRSGRGILPIDAAHWRLSARCLVTRDRSLRLPARLLPAAAAHRLQDAIVHRREFRQQPLAFGLRRLAQTAGLDGRRRCAGTPDDPAHDCRIGKVSGRHERPLGRRLRLVDDGPAIGMGDDRILAVARLELGQSGRDRRKSGDALRRLQRRLGERGKRCRHRGDKQNGAHAGSVMIRAAAAHHGARPVV